MAPAKPKRYDEQGNRLKFCSFRNHWLIASPENFIPNDGYNDGYMWYCRSCRKLITRGVRKVDVKILETAKT